MLPSNYLKRKKWIRELLYKYDENGDSIVGVCLIGAVAQGNRMGDNEYLDMLKKVCHERFADKLKYVGFDDVGVPYINDRIVKNKRQALSLLRETEKRLKVKE